MVIILHICITLQHRVSSYCEEHWITAIRYILLSIASTNLAIQSLFMQCMMIMIRKCLHLFIQMPQISSCRFLQRRVDLKSYPLTTSLNDLGRCTESGRWSQPLSPWVEPMLSVVLNLNKYLMTDWDQSFLGHSLVENFSFHLFFYAKKFHNRTIILREDHNSVYITMESLFLNNVERWRHVFR